MNLTDASEMTGDSRRICEPRKELWAYLKASPLNDQGNRRGWSACGAGLRKECGLMSVDERCISHLFLAYSSEGQCGVKSPTKGLGTNLVPTSKPWSDLTYALTLLTFTLPPCGLWLHAVVIATDSVMVNLL